MPTTVLIALPDFQTLRRPCILLFIVENLSNDIILGYCISSSFLHYTGVFVFNLGTSINDVRRFWGIFDLPTYLRPILSDLDKPTYLMTSDFNLPTNPPKILLHKT